jgi:acetoin utilization deacetylase AcuC-like enzyme
MKVFYDHNYIAAGHEFDTTRKAKWVADRIDHFVDITSPNTDGIENLIRDVHDNDYIDALKTGTPKELAQSQGFDWDEGLWRGILASTAGMVQAVEVALAGNTIAGSLSSGMHHAKYRNGDGFCSVNGLVVAAREAVRHGMKVTILDLDAHAGGGTDELLRLHDMDKVQHLDLTVSPYDCYDGVRSDADINIVLPNAGDQTYLAFVRMMLEEIPAGDDRLLIYNAGMDPYPQISRSALVEREVLVAEFVGLHRIPTVFGLAGGYTWNQTADEAAEMHVATVAAFSFEHKLQKRSRASSTA